MEAMDIVHDRQSLERTFRLSSQIIESGCIPFVQRRCDDQGIRRVTESRSNEPMATD
jgi:hypothetical protein